MEEKTLMAPLQIKEMGESGLVRGYASTFGEVDGQREMVARGAFTRSLVEMKKDGRNPSMLWMHDVQKPIGIWDDVREDARGLAVKGRLALRTASGAEAYELLRMGALSGLSIGFRTVKARTDAKARIRTLLDVELFEISLVTFPANTRARVSAVKTPYPTAEDDRKAIIARLTHAASILKQE